MNHSETGALLRACLLLFVVVLWACAAAEHQQPAVLGKDAGKIRIEARSFAFEPAWGSLFRTRSAGESAF